MSVIAFIDFDGNIYKGDSMLDFIKHVHGKNTLRRFLFQCIPQIIGYKAHIISSKKAKEKLLRLSFDGLSYNDLNDVRNSFACNINKCLFPAAHKEIKRLKLLNAEMVIVSASSDLWLEPWCAQNGFKLLATKLETIDDKITGNLVGENCRGQEKASRILASYDLKQYSTIYCFGNEKSDKYMLDLANQPIQKLYQ